MKAFLEPLYELGEFSEIQKSLSLYQGDDPGTGLH